MTAVYKDPFQRVLEDLYREARTTRLSTTSLEDYYKTHRKFTIDNFLEFLYSLFKNEGLLIDSQSSTGVDTADKFVFTEIYPDQPDDTPVKNIVTYEVVKREHTSYSSSAIGTKETVRYRPIPLGLVEDADGRLAVVVENHYTNIIRLTVWSEKAADARRIASAIENFFTVNYYVIRMHVGHLLYEGRTQTLMSDDYGNRRLYGIPLLFNVRTEEPGFIKQDDIVSIDTYGHVVDSLFLSELEKISKKINKSDKA